MEYLMKIDDKIYRSIEKFCHKFQRLTGKTNYFLAKIFAYIMLGSLLCGNINFYIKILVNDSDIFSFILNVFISLFIFFDLYQYDSAEKEQFEKVKTYRVFFIGGNITGAIVIIRFIYFLFFILLVFPRLIKNITIAEYKFFEILYHSYEIDFIIISYLLQVNPLPPSESKIKIFLNNLLFSKKLVSIKN